MTEHTVNDKRITWGYFIQIFDHEEVQQLWKAKEMKIKRQNLFSELTLIDENNEEKT